MEDIKKRLFQGISDSWLQFFSQPTLSNEINYVLGQVDWPNCIPSIDNVMNAFRFTYPEEVKVVIIGQDPYPGTIQTSNGQSPYAMGLSFSVSRNVPLSNIPGSLVNVFKCLRNNYPNIRIESGDLTKWALSGVLLLNTSLTLKGKDKINYWNGFTTGVIRELYTRNPKIIFVAWGNPAKELLNEIPRCIRVEGIHPSNATGRVEEFITAKHFCNINALLAGMGIPPIDFGVY
jgi:uracil-DNA glycosylase